MMQCLMNTRTCVLFLPPAPAACPPPAARQRLPAACRQATAATAAVALISTYAHVINVGVRHAAAPFLKAYTQLRGQVTVSVDQLKAD